MTQTILIAEDDPQMMEVLATMLQRAGYSVIKQPVLGDVISDLETNPDVGVVLLDIWHNGSPAFEILDQIKVTFPAVKTLMISGGGGYLSTEASFAIAELAQTDAVLMKPFTRSSLLSEVSKVLA
ncbi:MAG: response regulator [Pseudomonadota bacterium]